MFGLSVDIHQDFAQFFQQRQTDNMAIQARYAAAFPADFARHGNVVRVVKQFFPLEDFDCSRAPGAGELEGTLDMCQVGLRTDGIDVGMTAHKDIQGVHNDGFPGAGLPGQDDQAWPEFQVEPVDNGEVLDVQFSQHMHP